MATTAKNTESKSTESFAALFEESIALQEMRSGEVITAEVISIDNDFVIVNAGLKSESVIKAEEFLNDQGGLDVKVGDFVKVAIEKLEDGFGSTILSRDKAKKMQAWLDLEDAMNQGTVVKGFVSSRVKGGLRVSVNGITAFLPGSLVDVRPVKDTSPFENKEWDLKVIKIDKKRNNVVVSRKAVMEQSTGADRDAVIGTLTEGATVKGIIKNITDYGAFVDLGGIDGLLHITDLAWRRVKHPSEILNIGDEVEAKVLKFDQEKNRVSLGLKQLDDDPWKGLSRRYPVSSRLFGKVSNLTDYGAFVEIEAGIEGLVHVSEMDWTNKNIHPGKIAQLGDEVEVMILEIDEDRRRLSLGMKQCKSNPWAEFSETHKKGDKVSGPIKSITDFGIFIGLDGGIDGLIHLSDISWDKTGEEAIRNFKKGDDLEALIVAIDVEKERISLGLKQLSGDNFSGFTKANDKGSFVKGIVKSADASGIIVTLADQVEGKVDINEVSEDKIDDASTVVKAGDEIEVKILNIDAKEKTIQLSLKSKNSAKPKAAKKKVEVEQSSDNAGTTNLGALLKAKLDSKK
ncbi:MAG: 30S ribosomal protein S1 [Methylophilaceae bacterium]|nr:30S ribosomal protein S1 [Methylophilaceae bacterium]